MVEGVDVGLAARAEILESSIVFDKITLRGCEFHYEMKADFYETETAFPGWTRHDKIRSRQKRWHKHNAHPGQT